METHTVKDWQGQDTARRTKIGTSNTLAVSWDGRLVMWVSSGPEWKDDNPNLNEQDENKAHDSGFAFATFGKELITFDGAGRPDFSACFGDQNRRFASLRTTGPNAPLPDTSSPHQYPHIPDGDDPDTDDDYVDYYPPIPGTLGELGLLDADSLSNIMYPVPHEAMSPQAGNRNPYPSDEFGGVDDEGSYVTYQAYVTFQDQTKFWNGTEWTFYGASQPNDKATRYQEGTYPNGEEVPSGGTGALMKRNGRAKLKIIVNWSMREVHDVVVEEAWVPFQVTPPNPVSGATAVVGLSVPAQDRMYADTFEPTLTMDGFLMVGKGSPRQMGGDGSSKLIFFYNESADAFATDGWVGPWELHELHGLKDTPVNGLTLGKHYPIARRQLKDYDGSPLTTFSEGGYTWLSHDGRFLIYSCRSGGSGVGHPWVGGLRDGGGNSNRAQVSLVGSVTGWQLWRIDHAAVNPSRHMFTAWDQDSRTVFQRTGSFGFGPGFWELLGGINGLPMRDDGEMKLQLVNSVRLLYYELNLSPYQERDYGFYLPMTLMLALDADPDNPSNPTRADQRTIDLDRTPDLSGNGHFADVLGAQLPCEYFGLPSTINIGNVPGLYEAAVSPGDIAPGWGMEHVIEDSSFTPSRYWAKLADWKDGVDTDGIDFGGYTTIDTEPYAGEGDDQDMDSDTCWGRVGQAMFFKQSTLVRVMNTGNPPELNPGTTITGASDGMTASLWVNPNQARTGWARLMKHHFLIKVDEDGQVYASVDGDDGTTQSITTDPGGPPQGQVLPLVPDGEWTHIALTWQDTKDPDDPETPDGESVMRLFVKGVEVVQSPKQLFFDSLATNNGNVRIGCLNNCATDSDSAVVLLDEVALKNSAMTDGEVARAALLPVPTVDWGIGNASLPNDAVTPFVNSTHGRVPADNLYTQEKAELGADLFRDVQLSSDNALSCASCHDPAKGFQDNLATSVGISGATRRSTPTLYNLRYHTTQFWDGRAGSLEEQAVQPIIEGEMAVDGVGAMEAYLQNDADYTARFITEFADVFTASDIGEEHVRKALATYMRALTSTAAPADSELQGQELEGRTLFFGKARCSGCHSGPDFSDGRLHRTGTVLKAGDPDLDLGAGGEGAASATAGRARFAGAFKTPTLRNVLDTGPYFHDGSALELRDVIDFYNDGGVRSDGYALEDVEHDLVDEEINRPLELTSNEKVALRKYLEALNGGVINNGPPGQNLPPTVSVAINVGPMNKVRVNVNDTDDLDPSMIWTFELEVTFSNGSTASYTLEDGIVAQSQDDAYTFFLTPSMPVTGASARAADHHGLWSGWVSN
jgi:cytochrome c peroxidase